MSFSKKITELTKSSSEFTFLTQVKAIREYPPEIQKELIGLYKPDKTIKKADKTNIKLLGTLVNSILCQKKFVFMFSQGNFNKLLPKDKATRRNTISGEEFKIFGQYLIINRIIAVIRPAIRGSNKAGVYQVIDKDLRSLLELLTSNSIEADQMAQAIEMYEKGKITTVDTNSNTTDGIEVEIEVLDKDQDTNQGEIASQSQDDASPQSISSQDSPNYSLNTFYYQHSKALEHYSLVPSLEKINFCLNHNDFPSKYKSSFEDFLDLVTRGKDLTIKSIEFVNDRYVKLIREDKLRRLDCFFEYAQHVELRGLVLKDMEAIHDLMDKYYYGNFNSEDMAKVAFDEMLGNLKKFGQLKKLNESKFLDFQLMLSKHFTNKNPYAA